jgi:hypothetical protein
MAAEWQIDATPSVTYPETSLLIPKGDKSS